MLNNFEKKIIMESNSIHIVYFPSSLGYSAYSREMDGLQTEAKTVDELLEKVKHLINVRIEALADIGKTKESQELKEKEIILVEN